MTTVVIGIDPHMRSNTALVLDSQENVLAKQRFPNDRNGYRQLKRFAQPWADRTWAVEGARGVGLGLAQRIAADGERVLNVPARLSARVRALGGSAGARPTTPTPPPGREPGPPGATPPAAAPTRPRHG